MPVFSSEPAGSKYKVSRKLNDRGIDRQEPHRQALKCPKEGYVASASKRVRRRPPDCHFVPGSRDLREPSEAARVARGRVAHSVAPLPAPDPFRNPGVPAWQELEFRSGDCPGRVPAGSWPERCPRLSSDRRWVRRDRRTSHFPVSLMPCPFMAAPAFRAIAGLIERFPGGYVFAALMGRTAVNSSYRLVISGVCAPRFDPVKRRLPELPSARSAGWDKLGILAGASSCRSLSWPRPAQVPYPASIPRLARHSSARATPRSQRK